MLQAGTTLQGRFAVDRILGQGGMGAVYLVRHAGLGGRPMAIKEMVVSITDPREREEALSQFRREAEMLFDLQHAGLTRVSDFFEENGNQYLVMEFVDGSTLESIVNNVPGPLPVQVVCQWVDEVCDVLDYLHTRNPPVILRDLKPSNLMLDARGRVRIIDFGIARVLQDDSHTNTFIKGAGTAGYAPLEQYIGRTDHRADIYALGATFYALLTRSMPPVSVARMSGEHTVPPSQYNHAVTTELEAVVLTMMAVQREDRYQSVAEARAALQASMKNMDPASPGTSLINLERKCSRCSTMALPLATLCLRCGTPLEEGAQGPAWPTQPVPISSKAGLKAEEPRSAGHTEAVMMACPNCSIPMVPMSKVCFHCGTVIEETTSGRLIADKPANYVMPPPPPPMAPPPLNSGPTLVQEPQPLLQAGPTERPQAPAPPPKSHLMQGIVAGLVVALLGGGYLFMSHRPATLRLLVKPDGGSLYVDKKMISSNLQSGSQVSVESGTHEILVTLPGYKDYTDTVTVSAGQVQDLAATLPTNMVSTRIDISPPQALDDAQILIDGKSVEVMGSVTKELSVGKHHITIRSSRYLTKDADIEVASGGDNKFSYTLEERPGVQPSSSPTGPAPHPL